MVPLSSRSFIFPLRSKTARFTRRHYNWGYNNKNYILVIFIVLRIFLRKFLLLRRHPWLDALFEIQKVLLDNKITSMQFCFSKEFASQILDDKTASLP
jgi:hypothetical protein